MKSNPTYPEVFEPNSDPVLNDHHGIVECPICFKDTPRNKMVQDHCHDTGLQRGRICGPCNMMLGMAHDNPFVLKSGIEYLAGWFATHAKVIGERKARHGK